MNKRMTNLSLALTATFLVAMLTSCAAFCQSTKNPNENSARGKPDHRTWVIYQAYDDPRQDIQLEVGDAFRLMTVNDSIKFKPLRKLTARWDLPPAMIDLNPIDNTLLCGKIEPGNQPHDHGTRWLAIQTTGNDLINLYWAANKDCDHQSHPGHAKAEN